VHPVCLSWKEASLFFFSTSGRNEFSWQSKYIAGVTNKKPGANVVLGNTVDERNY
jgi:hypothetical protein